MVQIYFDTATFDEIERDVKVNLYNTTRISHFEHILCSGDLGVSSWSDWRHNGTLHRLLDPQRHRDPLLRRQVLLLAEIQEERISEEIRRSVNLLSLERLIGFFYFLYVYMLCEHKYVFCNKSQNLKNCSLKKNYFVFGQAHTFNILMLT